MYSTKDGALVTTWLYIVGHLATVNEIFQCLALIGATVTSSITIVDWVSKKIKSKKDN